MEPPLPQRQRSSALCPEWPEVAKKAEVFLQVIRRARFVLTEGGSGMRWMASAAGQPLPPHAPMRDLVFT
eukprot:scaffold37282_cov58-Phaeocystis_antarctica.AAC.5